MTKWNIYCEESGDKAIPWVNGSTHFYIVTAILVRETDDEALKETLLDHKRKVLRMRPPLEWKKLNPRVKRDDKILGRFFKKIDEDGPEFIVSQVICNKHETMGPGLVDRTKLMNYLYGLMFKRLSWFLKSTKATARLFIDRNTDPLAQESLRSYISSVTRYSTGEHPRHSKPKWMNPEEDPILGLADFLSGVTLKSMTDYHLNVNAACKKCGSHLCIYNCSSSNFTYKRSFKYIVDWCEFDFEKWAWRGLLYHPFINKDNYKNIFIPI
ncbi:DUF3800 domain-containing protein [Cohnella panacarvi]|uniref:DUF3800 domain-containing protein n=1 Tax=Cohnella panacarvi TaxID=400776 RepID=UPI00047A9E41|nr:DUF3800 domain-containing protein [Cohnella panacarvi]